MNRHCWTLKYMSRGMHIEIRKNDAGWGTRSSWLILLGAALATLLLPLAAWAQEGDAVPMVTDRPDATESALTVAPRSFQLESGYTFGRIEGISIHNAGEVLLRVGVVDWMEVRLGLNSYQWARGHGQREQGMQDSSLGVKLVVVESSGGLGFGIPQVAVLASTTLPTGNSLGSQGKLQPELRLAVAWDLSDRLALGANVAYAYPNDIFVDERFHQGGATLSLGYSFTDRMGAYLEYFGVYPIIKDGPDESFLNGGVTFLVTGDFQLDARLGYGLNGLDGDLFIGLGSAVRW